VRKGRSSRGSGHLSKTWSAHSAEGMQKDLRATADETRGARPEGASNAEEDPDALVMLGLGEYMIWDDDEGFEPANIALRRFSASRGHNLLRTQRRSLNSEASEK